MVDPLALLIHWTWELKFAALWQEILSAKALSRVDLAQKREMKLEARSEPLLDLTTRLELVLKMA